MPIIPARTLFVWTGRRFPYHARLAVESALLADPAAAVELHLFGDRPDEDPGFVRVSGLDRVSIHGIDEASIFEELPDAAALRQLYRAIPRTAYSARSNLLRYAVLHQRGGVYLDLDVLVVRSLAHLREHAAFVGEEEVWRVDEHRVAGELAPWMLAPTVAWGAAWGLRRLDTWLPRPRLEGVARRLDPVWRVRAINNAVIGAPAGSPFVRRLLAGALAADPRIRYALGPTLITRMVRASNADVTVLPPAAFYPVAPAHSFRFFAGGPLALERDTCVLHYVASNHGALLASLDEPMLYRRATAGSFWAIGAQVAERARALPRRSFTKEAA